MDDKLLNRCRVCRTIIDFGTHDRCASCTVTPEEAMRSLRYARRLKRGDALLETRLGAERFLVEALPVEVVETLIDDVLATLRSEADEYAEWRDADALGSAEALRAVAARLERKLKET